MVIVAGGVQDQKKGQGPEKRSSLGPSKKLNIQHRNGMANASSQEISGKLCG